MTIAIGILASDGLVVAADTLETAQGFWKGELGKVRFVDHTTTSPEGLSVGSCIVSGAGRTSLMVSLSQRLLAKFSEDKTIDEREALKGRFEETLQEFFTANIVPYPDAADSGLQMVIGYERNNRFGLWSSERGTLAEQYYAAVGIGDRHAKNVLQQMGTMFELSVQTVAAIAAYVIFDVKENIDGCGRYTDVAFIQNHRVRGLSRAVVEELEDTFREVSSKCQRSLLKSVFSETGVEFTSGTLKSVQEQVAGLIAKMPRNT